MKGNEKEISGRSGVEACSLLGVFQSVCRGGTLILLVFGGFIFNVFTLSQFVQELLSSFSCI